MKIPKQLKLLGHTVTVEFDNEYCEKNACFGSYIMHENKIILCDKYRPNNKRWVKIKSDNIEHVFLHELTHAVLYYMNRLELFEDEEFVDQFAGLLHQAINTMEYE